MRQCATSSELLAVDFAGAMSNPLHKNIDHLPEKIGLKLEPL
ncbi:hypothetical protein QUB68_22555 [Microcoleus sp. A006_D1]